jgi:4,5-DOPA dioxygenase extradiol
LIAHLYIQMTSFPAIFVSHGAPDLPLYRSPAGDFLAALGAELGRPQAILVISAHWNTHQPIASTAPQPATIHDFGGFPAELYQLRYPAPGAPDLADRAIDLLNRVEIRGELDRNRGLDHGAWTPLLLMYPDADVPVTQLSIQPQMGPLHHWAIGQAIAPLRQEGVLILASGSATHNLWEFDSNRSASPPVWVRDFADWLNDKVASHDVKSLLHYRQFAPHAARNHPTEEHLLPLFVALGAGGDRTTVLHNSYSYGAFSMAAYRFDGDRDSEIN